MIRRAPRSTLFPYANLFRSLLVIVTGSISVAVALPRSIALSVSDVASALISFGGVSFGAVVSTDRKSVVEGERVDLGCCRIIKKKVFPIGNAVVALFVIYTTPTV